ncbi:MAG: tetratricopeptide repeat protein [Elusimicrobia bacterium]|nr:tetratricopeptide repeat protein [Elusimicrobiota bacterium]
MTRAAALAAVLLAGAPAARAYDSIRFLEPVRSREMVRPLAAASSGDRLYVADGKAQALLIYDAEGRFLKSVAFREPRGVAVGPDGRVCVADAGTDRVQVLDRDGGLLFSFGARGSDPGRLRGPESVAVGPDGRLYVADTGNDRVQVFTPEGLLLFAFGRAGKEPGRFRSPARVSVDPSGGIYVFDRGNGRVQKFDARAGFVREYPSTGDDAVVDDHGFLYVLDGSEGRVVEREPGGAVLGRFGSYGSDAGQFKKARGVAVAPDGILLVLDTGNGRVQRVALTNKSKTAPLPSDPEAALSLSGPSRSWPLAASAVAPFGDDLFAYLPSSGAFVLLGPDGAQKARFGSSQGKDGGVTRGVGGLAAVPKRGLYASDTPDDRLQRFDLDGRWRANIGETQGFFESRAKEGRLSGPAGVAASEAGTVVYVADAGNRRVQAFNPEGVFLFSIGPGLGSFQLQEPVAVAWDKAGFLYVADKGLKKIFKCEPSGAFLSAWGDEGEGPGQLREPASLAVDERGDVYVLDARLRRVSVFDRAGRWLTDFLSGGRGPGELLGPAGLAAQDGRLVIADRGGGRIVSYDLRLRPAAPVAVSTAAKEGVVALSWRPADDPWVDGYQVLRSTLPGGPFGVVGRTKEAAFQDSAVAPERTYWYRAAAVARTGDVGPAGPAAAVFVAGAVNRAPVEISTVALGGIFAADYKRYLKSPVGRAVVTNNLNVPFRNVKLTFKLKDYMDFGFDTEIQALEPRQSVEVPLIATLNNKVLEVTEDTPVQAEFILSYFQDGQPKTAVLTKPLRLYSRNAISWDDPRKIVSFVTYKDEPVKAFRAGAAAAFKNLPAPPLDPAVTAALRIWSALAEHGLQFAANPANPFAQAHDDPNFPVDYTQYPRETLQRRSGQCSDLTSLYAALLRNDEVRSAVIDYPGHMALMFDTGAEDAVEAGLPSELLVEREGTMWIPVETTAVGRPFLEAVSKAAYAYKAESEQGRARVFDVDAAFAEHEPVSMPPTDFSPAPPDAAALRRRFDEQAEPLAKESRRFLAKHYEDRLQAAPQDADARLQLGIVAYRFGDRAAAAEEFRRVLTVDPGNAAALNNLGGVAFLAGDYAQAEASFLQAAETDPADPDIWLNLLKVEVKLKKPDQAREYGAKTVALAGAYKPVVDGLVNGL